MGPQPVLCGFENFEFSTLLAFLETRTWDVFLLWNVAISGRCGQPRAERGRSTP